VILGTYAIKCFDNFGNQYTTGQTVNFTDLAATSVTLSFTVYNSATNTGYRTTYDSLDNVNQACGVELSTAGSDVSLPTGITGGTGAQAFARGTNTYWSTILSDSSLTNQKVGLTQPLQGQAPFSITINQAALSAGNDQDFNIALVAPFDSAYFANNGVGGPNAASLASFAITVGA
jgi:hypothetical protein